MFCWMECGGEWVTAGGCEWQLIRGFQMRGDINHATSGINGGKGDAGHDLIDPIDECGTTRQMGFIESVWGTNWLLRFAKEAMEGIGSKGNPVYGMATKRKWKCRNEVILNKLSIWRLGRRRNLLRQVKVQRRLGADEGPEGGAAFVIRDGSGRFIAAWSVNLGVVSSALCAGALECQGALLLLKMDTPNLYTSRIACHVITATVKGQGYSLAADIQYVDARWGYQWCFPYVTVSLDQELSMLCRMPIVDIYDFTMMGLILSWQGSLKTVEVLDTPRSGINGLVSTFVKLLQEENASRECTIVRTAGKLTPFDFNRMPASDDLSCNLASLRRQKKYNLKSNESLPPESFCPICNSPLSKSNLLSLNDVENGQLSAETFGAKCCLSCLFQILPKERSSVEHFYSFLPQPIIAQAKNDNHCNRRWLR
ncbi:hypothetical protein RHSIM_Rhsim03G0020400 [Rhododendron simsii]|uniref:Uncharacterized protein n=1 Tax=Rhododendron simsii TaxID=118357 RepID=A0A834H610_RHOSS|nr:hypothetical protein RHSIM_Rhsim03G0020400 [Rhododendron simsii]